jgi:uncharacterized protein (DUF2249 family)
MSAPVPLTLDVRDILRSGGEPFGAIMQNVSALAPGQALRLLATFRPMPLFAVMAARGFTHTTQALADGDWEVLFSPKTKIDTDAAPGDATSVPQAFDDAPAQTLDNRDLPPPEPMVRTLQALKDMPAGAILEVFVDREPLILYNELRQRGHSFQPDKQPDGSYRVLIRHSG